MIQSNPLSAQVYDHLLNRILASELPPGASLREVDLAEEFGVSRTPVREALARLAEDGLVEIRPNRRTVVRRLGATELIEIYQIREALEGKAAELACGKLTSADFARLDGLAAQLAGGERVDWPDYLDMHYQLDVALHRLVATRSGNRPLAREIHKYHNLMYLLRDRFAKQEQQLRLADRQHFQIIAALKSGDPAASRQAMVEHLRTFAGLAVQCFKDSSVAACRLG